MATTGSREPGSVGSCPSQFVAHQVFHLCVRLRFPRVARIDWWPRSWTFILLACFIRRSGSAGSFRLRLPGAAVRSLRSSLR